METLYEQLGGKANIKKLVTAFYQRVLADPLLMPFFKDSEIEKLERMQNAFFTVALGGPEPTTKLSLYEAHQGRGIQTKHLTRFTEHLLDTLKELGIEEERAKKVYERIATHANEILGDSNVDG